MAVSPVDWDLAEQVAVRVAGREPFAESYHYASLQPDFDELTAEAEALVAEATGLRSLAGPARARVTDRAGWVHANVESFRRLLRPAHRQARRRRWRRRRSRPSAAPSPAPSSARCSAGCRPGCSASTTCSSIEDEDPDDQDIVYYVGPNVLALEKRFGFPPREFRLWLALHEVTHRAQFTGVPWMAGYFRGARRVDDPERSTRAPAVCSTRCAARSTRSGPAATRSTRAASSPCSPRPSSRSTLQKVQGLMSLLEGHGDVTMDRAGAARIPSAGAVRRGAARPPPPAGRAVPSSCRS